MVDDARSDLGVQASPAMAAALRHRLALFLAPLRVLLDAHLDHRLVCTFAARIETIVRPPVHPIFVPGRQWIGVLVLGMSGPPTVAAMRWWTSRGARASDKRSEEGILFAQCVAVWGRRVVQVWDRGCAGRVWLTQALTTRVRFVLRWPGRYKLLTAAGEERKAWQIARGKRSWAHRRLWHARRHCARRRRALRVEEDGSHRLPRHPSRVGATALAGSRPAGQEARTVVSADDRAGAYRR